MSVDLAQVFKRWIKIIAIHWINLYSLDSAIDFPNTHSRDNDLAGG